MNFKYTDEALKKLVKDNVVPGCAAAVSLNGEIVYRGAYGRQGEGDAPMTTDSIFELCSASKVIVMTAALILFERGKFLLQEPISEYLPAYKNMNKYVLKEGKWEVEPLENPILIEHCFHMACGMPYGFVADSEEENAKIFASCPTALGQGKTRKALIEKYNGKYDILTEASEMAKVPVMFEPGTHWMYGYGHELVSALIKVTSGMETGEFIKREIFDPLGMTSSSYRYLPTHEGRLVDFMAKEGESFKAHNEFSVFSFAHAQDCPLDLGGGGLLSSVNDYIKFATMLANGGTWKGEKIISRKTIDLMRTDRLNEAQRKDFDCSYNRGYGYGLGVRTMIDPSKTSNGSVGEFGWTGYGGTYVAIDPEEKLAMFYGHQTVPNNEEYCHHRFRNSVYGSLTSVR